LRTGAWRTHHHRVVTTLGLSGSDIATPFLSLCCRCTSDTTPPQVAILFEKLFKIL
jgi:hypothetical protein